MLWRLVKAALLFAVLMIIPACQSDSGRAAMAAFQHVGEFFDHYESLFLVLATIAIAVFTWTLKQSTDKLWNANKGSLDLAREEFVSVHRPRLRIRNVELIHPVPPSLKP